MQSDGVTRILSRISNASLDVCLGCSAKLRQGDGCGRRCPPVLVTKKVVATLILLLTMVDSKVLFSRNRHKLLIADGEVARALLSSFIADCIAARYSLVRLLQWRLKLILHTAHRLTHRLIAYVHVSIQYRVINLVRLECLPYENTVREVKFFSLESLRLEYFVAKGSLLFLE